MCDPNPIEVVDITPPRRRTLWGRVMLIIEFPVALVEMISDFVRLWWRERRGTLNDRD
jgi:hypothetical protein